MKARPTKLRSETSIFTRESGVYGVMSTEVNVPKETNRYLRDAGEAAENPDLGPEISSVRYIDDREEQRQNIDNLYETAENRDCKQFLWIALQTLNQ